MTTEQQTRTTFERAVKIIYSPHTEWPLIAQEAGDLQSLIVPYTLWVALLPGALAAIVPSVFLSFLTALTGQAPRGLMAVVWGVIWGYALGMGALLLAAKVLSILAASWNASTDWLLWCRVLVYGSTPYFLAGAFLWIPLLGYLFMIACAVRSMLLIRQGYQTILKRAPTVAEPIASAGPVL